MDSLFIEMSSYSCSTLLGFIFKIPSFTLLTFYVHYCFWALTDMLWNVTSHFLSSDKSFDLRISIKLKMVPWIQAKSFPYQLNCVTVKSSYEFFIQTNKFLWVNNLKIRTFFRSENNLDSFNSFLPPKTEERKKVFF